MTSPEAQMVRLAVALVADTDPRLHIEAIVRGGAATGLSEAALTVVRRVLTRGMAQQLARGGASALWTLPPMRFGSASLDLLHWLHTTRVALPERPALAFRSAPTAVESILCCRAIDLVVAARSEPPRELASLPICWLFRPRILAERLPIIDANLDRLEGDAWLIACSQDRIHSALDGWCRWSRHLEDPAEIARHGALQEQILTAILRAIGERVEAARFLAPLVTTWAALPDGVWEVPRNQARISIWAEARRGRVALPRVASRWLSERGTRWRGTGFLDDGYDEAQAHLQTFEGGLQALGPLAHVVSRAEGLPEVA